MNSLKVDLEAIPYFGGPEDGASYREFPFPTLLLYPGGRYLLTGLCGKSEPEPDPEDMVYIWYPYYDVKGNRIDFPLPPGLSEEDLL
jgi:hypothetical protein